MGIQLKALPTSPYFKLQELAEGVYAAISIPGMGSWANAGIIDIGGQTIIFDTFATVTAAKDLRRAAEQLTGRKASYVINSHYHIDHVFGNQVFQDAAIISTPLTRNQIAERQPKFIEMVKNHPEHLNQMKKEMELETNSEKRHESEILLSEYTAIDQEINDHRVTLPSITFENKITLNGSRRTADIITYGGGHSMSDSFLYLAEDRILFLADLIHIGFHADFRQGNLEEWIKILDKVKELEIDIVVSGHGSIGSAADLTIMKTYLSDLKEFARSWSDQGGTAEYCHEAAIPDKYAHYGVPSVFYGNLRYLLQNC